MNSECGMVWGVQDSAGDSDLGWQYHYMLNEYRLHENLCGFVFTEMNDVVNEFNGYYRIDNKKKDFGYAILGMGMDLRDMHAKDFLAYDAAPCRTVGAGETVETPVFYSNFGGAKAGEALRLEYFLHGMHGYAEAGHLDFTCRRRPAAPGRNPGHHAEGADTAALTFRLCKDGKVLSRNFCCFDVRGPRLALPASGRRITPSASSPTTGPRSPATSSPARARGASSTRSRRSPLPRLTPRRSAWRPRPRSSWARTARTSRSPRGTWTASWATARTRA